MIHTTVVKKLSLFHVKNLTRRQTCTIGANELVSARQNALSLILELHYKQREWEMNKTVTSGLIVLLRYRKSS
ncbi:hypothetical protein MAMMFC1_01796 [Methylomusa anaerophila]|uniref:Uncharacterized protein n=1 Tax=Methylomusa anaerophila TaxID=1930071 RepID=A0A348AJ79_9FIRM|nr:hypothetical protein MAMMFC1_01796 [Methylomusa anaerophila]